MKQYEAELTGDLAPYEARWLHPQQFYREVPPGLVVRGEGELYNRQGTSLRRSFDSDIAEFEYASFQSAIYFFFWYLNLYLPRMLFTTHPEGLV